MKTRDRCEVTSAGLFESESGHKSQGAVVVEDDVATGDSRESQDAVLESLEGTACSSRSTLRLHGKFCQFAGRAVRVEVTFLEFGAPVIEALNCFVEEELNRTVVGKREVGIHAQSERLVHARQVVQVFLAEPTPNAPSVAATLST